MLPEDCSRLRSWFDETEQTTNGAEYHIKAYVKYANNTADGISAREMRATA